MNKKNSPLSIGVREKGNVLESSNNLHCQSGFVKLENENNFRFERGLFNGYRLQDKLQDLVYAKLGEQRNKNFCKCNRVTLGGEVEIHRNKETGRASFSGIVQCYNSFFCPVCGGIPPPHTRLTLASLPFLLSCAKLGFGYSLAVCSFRRIVCGFFFVHCAV